MVEPCGNGPNLTWHLSPFPQSPRLCLALTLVQDPAEFRTSGGRIDMSRSPIGQLKATGLPVLDRHESFINELTEPRLQLESSLQSRMPAQKSVDHWPIQDIRNRCLSNRILLTMLDLLR